MGELRSKKTALAIASLAIALVCVWFQYRPVPVRVVGPEDVVAEAERGGYRLIDLQDLVKLHEERPQDLLLVDTRQDWEYRGGYIEGAVLFPMEPTWWARVSKRAELRTLLGPDKGGPTVFY